MYFKLFEEVSFMSSGGIQIDGEPGPLIFCSCTIGLFCVDSVYDLLTEFCNVLFFQYRKRWISG